MNQKINQYGYYILHILGASIFLSVISPVFITLTMAFLALLGIIKNKFTFLKRIFQDKFAVFVSIFFIYLLGTFFYFPNLQESVNFLQPKIMLWAFPLIIIQFDLTASKKQSLFNTFIWATLIVIIFIIINNSIIFLHEKNTNIFFVDNLSSLLEMQPAVFSSYCCVALVLLISKIATYYSKSILQLVFYISVFVLILITIVFLGSKLYILIGMLIMIVFIFHFLFFAPNSYKFLFIIVLMTIGIGLICFIFNNTNLKNRFRGIQKISMHYDDLRTELFHQEEYDSSRWTTISYRLALIQCGWQAISEHFVFGAGIGGRHNALLKAYENKGFKLAIQRKSSLHNSYLEIWLSGGIIGLFLFIITFYYTTFFKIFLSTNYLHFLILLIMVFALAVDNFLDRFQGIAIFTFILSLVNYIPKISDSNTQIDSL